MELTVRERAAAALDADADASPAEARAAFLKRLVADGFSPPEEAVWAANALAGTALPLSDGGRAEAAATEAELVDRFAREYWSLHADVRRERWHSLNAMLTDPEAKTRMAELEAGLAFDTAPHENPLVESVAAAIRELYVLPPREFIVRRTQWLIANRKDIVDLRDASKRLRSERHAFNRLAPSVAVELARTPPLEAVEPIDPLFAQAEQEDITRKEIARAESAEQRRVQAEAAVSSSGSGGGGWVIYVAIGIALFAFRTCYSSTRTDPTPSFRFDLQQTWKSNVPKPVSRFTNEQLLSFADYERRKSLGERDLVEPPGYTFYRLNGGTVNQQGVP